MLLISLGPIETTIFSAFCLIILDVAPGIFLIYADVDVINELDVLFPVENTIIVIFGIHHRHAAAYNATAVVFSISPRT